jgi:hypothetical protein
MFAGVTYMISFLQASEILVQKTREFDRSSRSVDAVGTIAPWFQVGMKTSDHRFKQSRMLVKDLMTPNFLNSVCRHNNCSKPKSNAE